MTQQNNEVQAALEWYEKYFSQVYGGYILDLPHHKTIRAALTAQLTKTDDNVSCPSVANTGDINAELFECLNDAINLWDAQNPLNPDDINRWRKVSNQSKESIEYIADAIVKAIADILYLANTYERIGKFKGTIDELTIVLNRLGLNEDDDCAEQKGQNHE